MKQIGRLKVWTVLAILPFCKADVADGSGGVIYKTTNVSSHNPEKGIEFTIASETFDRDVKFCTVKEPAGIDLHFADPEIIPDDPNVLSADDGRVMLDRTNKTNCKVVIKTAETKDHGTWHFQIGLGHSTIKDPRVWYQHNASVEVKVDCELTDWDTTGECSEDCGGGKRTETRTEKVEPLYNGKPCDEDRTREEDCNTQVCPVTTEKPTTEGPKDTENPDNDGTEATVNTNNDGTNATVTPKNKGSTNNNSIDLIIGCAIGALVVLAAI